jgi:hypothetical protein
MKEKCPNGHSQSWQCHAGAPPACRKCENDRKQAAKKAQKDLDEKLKREEKLQKHIEEVAKIEEEIAQIVLRKENQRLVNEQQAVLAQKRKDLETIKARSNQTQYSPPGDPLGIHNDNDPTPRNEALKTLPKMGPTLVKSTPHRHSNLQEHIKTSVKNNKSPSKTEWQHQKKLENAINPAIDEIMEMIGLEEVKAQVLRIKAKVETCIRQGTNIKKERLGLVLLGNPGTGMVVFIPSCE